MADITFYFPSSGTPDHDCAYATVWNNPPWSRQPMPTSKGTTSFGGGGYPYKSSGNPRTEGGRQFVSGPMAARSWTTADTFDIACITRDTGSKGPHLYVNIRIFNAAGDTVVGTLYTGQVNTNDWATGYEYRHADGISIQNNVDMPENGHLVVELGGYFATDLTGSTDLVIGEGVGTSPAPLSDTSWDDVHYPWISFTYGSAGPVQPSSISSGEGHGNTAMMKGHIQSEVA